MIEWTQIGVFLGAFGTIPNNLVSSLSGGFPRFCTYHVYLIRIKVHVSETLLPNRDAQPPCSVARLPEAFCGGAKIWSTPK